MSPEIKIGTKTIINVPDETGRYETESGSLYVNTDLIDASRKNQRIILESDAIGGLRVLGLTQEGIGKSDDPKRGDRKLPHVLVTLHDRPIRISYKGEGMNSYGGHWDGGKETHRNPRWMKGHGQR